MRRHRLEQRRVLHRIRRNHSLLAVHVGLSHLLRNMTGIVVVPISRRKMHVLQLVDQGVVVGGRKVVLIDMRSRRLTMVVWFGSVLLVHWRLDRVRHIGTRRVI